MNALWISRLCAYKNTSLSLGSARRIIAIKIERENVLLKKYKRKTIQTNIRLKNSLNDILLEEARVAKSFWRSFSSLLPSYLDFPGRKARRSDIVNRFLDIGYHHLTNIVRGILDKYEIPGGLAVLHVPRTSKSSPLAYDLVEMFRSDIVETEILKFFRLKKKKINKIEKDIPKFIAQINERLEKKYYLKNFKTCHSYKYYMEVQILKFVKAVNKKEIFMPINLPKRHESRCT